MYLLVVVALTLVAPLASIAAEWAAGGGYHLGLLGKWFVFWAVGVRLLIAGARQAVQPDFTASTIFGVTDRRALSIVQELGFANIATGLLGALTLVKPNWTPAAALVGCVFYALAGAMHATKGDRNATETIAMISDLFVAAVLAFYLVGAMLV